MSDSDNQGGEGAPAVSGGARVALALAIGALTLAVSLAFRDWVLFTDTLVRRIFF